MNAKILPAIMISLTLAGCASSSSSVGAHYVSPLQYQSYDCDQLEMEYSRISRRVAEVTGRQDDAAARDAVGMGVGLILFWPALFLLAGSDHADELGRIKGEAEAIEQASIQKSCGLSANIAASRAQAMEEEKARRAKENQSASDSMAN